MVTAPSMALMIAAFGGTGVVAGLAAFVTLLAQGSEDAPPEQLGPMLVMFAFFGIASSVMCVAGGLSVRSGLVVVRRDSGELRWLEGGEAGSIRSEDARLVVRQQGFGTYRYFSVLLLGSEGEQPLELGGGVLESLAQARCRWFARSLKLEPPRA